MFRRHKAQTVVGIDLSEQMMAIGAKKLQRNGYSATFVTTDAQAMPFADNRFDGVTCAYGCRNFSNLHAGLSEMYRVLRSGGSLVILEFSYPTRSPYQATIRLLFFAPSPLHGQLYQPR